MQTTELIHYNTYVACIKLYVHLIVYMHDCMYIIVIAYLKRQPVLLTDRMSHNEAWWSNEVA